MAHESAPKNERDLLPPVLLTASEKQVSQPKYLAWTEGPQAQLGFSASEAAPPTNEQLLAFAKAWFRVQEQRSHFVSSDLLGEPGWDMLLALHIATAEERRMTITDLVVSSGAPSTTALRWMDSLRQQGLVTRRRNPLDARVVYIELEPEGRARMIAFLEHAYLSLRFR